VLLHELAHIRRRDLVWSWIGEIARIVYFYHPVVHWINYQARLERELACDQLAMAVSGRGPEEYAAMLVQVVSHASEPSVFKTAASARLEGEPS
jgi:bla regulator protein blaR1